MKKKTQLDDVGTRLKHLTDFMVYLSENIEKLDNSMKLGKSAIEERNRQKNATAKNLLNKYVHRLEHPSVPQEGEPAVTFKIDDVGTRYTHLADLYEAWNDARDIYLDRGENLSDKEMEQLSRYLRVVGQPDRSSVDGILREYILKMGEYGDTRYDIE